MKPAHFHFIRTASFVRDGMAALCLRLAPPVATNSSLSQNHPHRHPPTHPTHTAASVPTADNSRLAFTLHFLNTTVAAHTNTHTHTLQRARISSLQMLYCETSNWMCIYYHQLTCDSLCSLYLFVYLFFIAGYSGTLFIHQPKGSFDGCYLSELPAINLPRR